MLESILREHGDELLGALTGAGGLDRSEAKDLLPPAVDGIGQALSGSGGLDLGRLLGSLGGGGGTGAIVSQVLGQLDLGAIASQAGVAEGKARSGLEALIPVVVSLLGQKGGVEGLLSQLGGGKGAAGLAGAVGGLAGKLFGK